MAKSYITFVEKNIHGAWVVYGDIGFRQYYGYSERAARRLYNEEAAKKVLVHQKEA